MTSTFQSSKGQIVVAMCKLCYAEWEVGAREVPTGHVMIVLDDDMCECGRIQKKCSDCAECTCGHGVVGSDS